MAQHDYNIANGTGLAVRSDLNGALSAIATNNSGAAAPSPTYPHQWWADTAAGIVKIRNAGNSAWLNVMPIAGPTTIGYSLLSAVDAPGARTALSNAVSGVHLADGAASLNRGLRISTAGVPRWEVLTDASAETGGNAGSNFALSRYSDAGVFLDVPLRVDRATGRVTATGLAPVPQTGAGGGQWVRLNSGFGGAAVLPAGGSWAWVLQRTNGAGAVTLPLDAGVNAGGLTLYSAVSGDVYTGMAWRIA
jgi:hypothetical protein